MYVHAPYIYIYVWLPLSRAAFLGPGAINILVIYKDYNDPLGSTLLSETTRSDSGGFVMVTLIDDPVQPYQGAFPVDGMSAGFERKYFSQALSEDEIFDRHVYSVYIYVCLMCVCM